MERSSRVSECVAIRGGRQVTRFLGVFVRHTRTLLLLDSPRARCLTLFRASRPRDHSIDHLPNWNLNTGITTAALNLECVGTPHAADLSFRNRGRWSLATIAFAYAAYNCATGTQQPSFFHEAILPGD